MMLRPWVAFPELDICFAFMPKVANTSMKVAFAELLNMHGYNRNDATGIHSHFIGVSPDDIVKLDCLKIMFVRNPFDRLVSAWQSKLIDKQHHAGFDQYGFKHNMSFKDFAEGVCEIPDDDSDHHFRGQTYEMYSQGVALDIEIGNFEYLEEGWEMVQDYIPDLPHLKHHQKSHHWNYKRYYDDDLVDKVAKRYAQDLEELGYVF